MRKKEMKRILSVFMSVIMVFQVMGITTLAQTQEQLVSGNDMLESALGEDVAETIKGEIETDSLLRDSARMERQAEVPYHAGDVSIIEKIVREKLEHRPEHDEQNMDTWWFANWEEIDGVNRVVTINLSGYSLTGELDVSGLEELSVLECSYNQLTSLNLVGVDNFERVHCQQNQVKKVQFSDSELFEIEDGINGSGYIENCYNYDGKGVNVKAKADSGYIFERWETDDVELWQPEGRDTYVNMPNHSVILTPHFSAFSVTNCNESDLDAVRTIIETHKLDATHSYDLEDPISWGFVRWDNSEERRIILIDLSSHELTGELDVSGLSELREFNCEYNQLSGLNMSGLDLLEEVKIHDNRITEILFSEQEILSVQDGEHGNGYINYCDFSDEGKVISVHAEPDSDYIFERWESDQVELERPEDGNMSFFMTGEMVTLTPHFSRLRAEDCDANDLTFIKNIIEEHELTWYNLENPATWDFVKWDDSEKKRAVSLDLSWKNLKEELVVKDLDALKILNCAGNNITALRLDGLSSLELLACWNNALSILEMSGLTNLQTMVCFDNQIEQLDLQGLDSLAEANCQDNPIQEVIFPDGRKLSLASDPGGIEGVHLDNVNWEEEDTYVRVRTSFVEGYSFSHWSVTGMELDDEDIRDLDIGFRLPGYDAVCTAFFTEISKETCDSGDIDVINAMIENNSLGAMGYEVDKPGAWDFVRWSNDTKKRIVSLGLNDKELTGVLNLQGLSKLEWLECESNQLTIIDARDLGSLNRLYCRQNILTDLQVTGSLNLMDIQCEDNNLSELNLYGLYNVCYLSLYDNSIVSMIFPNGKELALSVNDEAGGKAGIMEFEYFEENQVGLQAESNFGYIFNGWEMEQGIFNESSWMWFTMPDDVQKVEINAAFEEIAKEDCNQNDIAVINQLIENNGLDEFGYEQDAPEGWGFIRWNKDTPRRITSLDLNGMDLYGSIDLRPLDKLKVFKCIDNQISEINLTGLTELEAWECSDNPIKMLLFPQGEILEININDSEKGYVNFLDLWYWTEDGEVETKIDLEANPYRGYSFMAWETEDVDLNEPDSKKICFTMPVGNEETTVITANFDQISADKCNQNDLNIINKIIEDNGLIDIGYQVNESENWDFVTWTNTTEKRVKKLSLNYLYDYDHGELALLGNLDLEGLEALEMLDCGESRLTSLSVKNLVTLKSIICEYGYLEQLNLQGAIGLESLRCSGNRLKSLELSNLSNLEYVECYGNLLENIELDGAVKLRKLECRENLLKILDLSGVAQLQYLDCADNQLDDLDISNNAQLSGLDCADNQLNILDTSNAENFKYLYCMGNKLKYLDLSKSKSLWTLSYGDNPMEEIYLPNQGALKFQIDDKGTVHVQQGYWTKEGTDFNHYVGLQALEANSTFDKWEISGVTIPNINPKEKALDIAFASTSNDIVIKAIFKLENIEKPKVNVKSIKLDKPKLTLAKGKTDLISAKILPANATTRILSWISSDTKVAEVNASGKVTAKGYGKANITAEAVDGSGVKTVCQVTVGYPITYKLNKGKNNAGNPAAYYKTTVKLKAPTRKGYVFKGWYTDKKFKKKITSISSQKTGAYTVYAKWEKVKKPANTSIKSVKNLKGGSLKVTISKKVAGIDGYEVECALDKKFKKGKVSGTMKAKSTSATIKKLTKGKTYHVRVRAFRKDSTGERIYGKSGKTKTVKISK